VLKVILYTPKILSIFKTTYNCFSKKLSNNKKDWNLSATFSIKLFVKKNNKLFIAF
jgi:hypothetical protein